MSDSVTTASGLFTHTKAEEVFQRMLETVERHEKDMVNLRWKVEKSVQSTLESIRLRVEQINDEIVNLGQRVEHVENCIKIPGSTSVVSVGEGLACNRRALARTLNLVAAKADTDEMNEMFTEYDIKLQETVKELQRDLANNDTISKVNEAMEAIGRRVDLVTDDLKNKVDNSMFKTMSSEYNLIRNYSQFVNDSKERSKEQEQKMEEQKKELLHQSESINDLIQKTMQLEEALETNKPWTNDVDQIISSLETKVESCVISEQNVKIQTLEERLALTEQENETKIRESHTSVHDSLVCHVEKKMKHVMEESSSSFVNKDKFMEIMKQLADEIESKASVTEINKEIQKLSSEHFITRRKVDLAAQFIEWYSRGSSEHSSMQSIT